MNAKREVYYVLSQVALPTEDPSRFPDCEASLCYFCKFARWSGSCEDPELECEHPLLRPWDCWEPDEVWQGSDCWGFRPDVSIELAAEWVGQRLQGKLVTLPLRRFGDELVDAQI